MSGRVSTGSFAAWVAPVLSISVLAALVAGCSVESDTSAALADGCTPPSRLVGERCLEPGVRDDGCPAGTLALGDGSCRPAGIPPELCAEGFVHDGDVGCEPILPAEACAEGQMAIPGDEACHAVSTCGAGKWGDIPVDSTSIYVDGSYPGADSDGSEQKPWTTIAAAVAAAPNGALIAVAAGKYLEDVELDARVSLWGVCPDEVELAGTGAAIAALFVRPGSSESEVRGIAVTGTAAPGIVVSGAEHVLVEHVWVHDARLRGLDVESSLGPTSVTLKSSLVEQNSGLGVFVAGSEVTIEGVVVRDSVPLTSGQEGGRGIAIQSHATSGAPSSALVTRSLFERNHEFGVIVVSSEVTIEGVVVRDTLPAQSDQRFGRGILIQPDPATGVPASALVRSSLVERNHELGVFVAASEVTIEGVVVRGTLPDQSNQEGGGGIAIQPNPITAAPANANVKSSLFEQNHQFGVYVYGSEASIEGVVVRDTLPRQSTLGFGRGIHIQGGMDARASVLVKGSVVERNHDVGIMVIASDATVDAVVVCDTFVRAKDGLVGDGIGVMSLVSQSPLPANALVTHVRVENSARAGVGNFGAVVALGQSALACNAFDLDGETFFDLPYDFENLGANGCGCPEPTGACAAKSSGLVPPEVLPGSM